MQHQVLSNMIDFGMEPQMALDAPRFCIKAPIAKKPDCDAISVEDGVSRTVVGELREMGHTLGDPLVGHERALFGRGQVRCLDRCKQAKEELRNQAHRHTHQSAY
mmetsp:Transcript_11603/g.27016  ORF Transcript_11603/g.27016 Transcript_11603/m.27016 type:complete len:105 (-) Transcript_11603:277-591(-)